MHDRLGEDGGGCRAVAGDVVGLSRDLVRQLSAHVGERLLELDLLGDSYAVVGDHRRPELLSDYHRAAARAEGNLQSVGQGVDALLQGASGVLIEYQLFGHRYLPFLARYRSGSGQIACSCGLCR